VNFLYTYIDYMHRNDAAVKQQKLITDSLTAADSTEQGADTRLKRSTVFT